MGIGQGREGVADANEGVPTMSFLSTTRGLGDGGGVEMGVGKVRLDAGPEPEHGGGVGDVRGLRLASSSSEKASDATAAVDDNGPRIARGREHAGVLVVVVHRPLLGHHTGIVVANEREDSRGASDGNARSITALDDDEAMLVVVVEHIRAAHELLADHITEGKETIGRVLEGGGPVITRVHLEGEYVGGDLRAWE